MAKKTKKKKATTKAGAAQGSKPARTGEVLLVGSKVKAAIKNAGCNTGGDSIDALNQMVLWYIGQATARAAANGRKTVRGHDFVAAG